MIRISTDSVYQNAVTNFNNMQAEIANSINEVDTGIALSSPSVNPAAAAQVLVATQGSDVNTQYGVNGQDASGALNTQDGILSGVTNLLQSLESQVVEAGSGALSNTNRATMASQFTSSLNQLLSLANSEDSNGNYVFSGTTVGTQPYTATPNGAQYNGSQQTQMIQVDTAQQLPVNGVGSSIFGNITVSPNVYFGIANGNNTSTATISTGTLSGTGTVTGDNYSISFTSPTTYNVTDLSTGAVVSTANPYTSGGTIAIPGAQFTITDGTGANGPPATGDEFTVQPGNQNIFQVLTTLASALNQGVSTSGDQTNLATALAQANTSISASLGNVLDARDQIGNSLQQIQSLSTVDSTLNVSYQTTIGTLQDVNYAQAISQLSEEQFTYQAAQKAFASTSQLSLISMLPVT
jgi:flagellar hook-associated protein 3 FlgL